MADIRTNLNTSPYYDNSLDELEKGYVKYLALEGRVLQNRELNVSQGLIYGNMKKINDLLIDDGSIISGCNYVNDVENEICTLYSGEIYINGVSVKVPETSWTYAQVPVGLGIIYVEVQSMVYSEIDDPSLYDPAENMENHGNRGGHRLKYNAVPGVMTEVDFNSTALDNPTYVGLIRTKGRNHYGPLKPKPVFGKIYRYLAQRTYDTSGDFISTGLKVYAEQNKNNPNLKFTVRIKSGRAYVKGYDYAYDKDVYIINDTAIDTDSTSTGSNAPEGKTYNTGTDKYYLNQDSVKSIDEVTATVEAIGIDMSYTGNDPIPATYLPITSLDQVYEGGTVYTAGVNYNLSGNTIIWVGGESHPAGAYTIDVTYTKTLTENVDYYVSKDDSGHFVNFIDGGIKPKNTTVFFVEYTWYLPRIDLVYLKEDGYIAIKRGIPGSLSEIEEPKVPSGALPLSNITIIPEINPLSYSVQNYNIYRVPVAQLQNMKNKIEELEYNVTLSRLEELAQNRHNEDEDMTLLRNILVDPIVDYSRVDLYNPGHNATVDIFRSETRLPMNIEQIGNDLVTFTDDTETEVTGNGILYVDKLGDVITDWQPYATHNIDIEPFYYRGLIPRVECVPYNTIYVEDDTDVKVVWLPNRIIYSSKIVNNWNSTITGNIVDVSTETKRTSLRPGWWDITTETKTTTRDSEIVGEEVVETKKGTIEMIPQPYIKAGSVIKIVGYDWPADQEIRLYMDGQVITTEFTDLLYSDIVSPVSESNVPSDITLETYTTVRRPWCWKWMWKNDKYKFVHPLYNGEGISYHYDPVAETWWYLIEDTVPPTLVELTDVPSWIKWITRTPWISSYISTIPDPIEQTFVESINNYETITEVEYPEDYAETNIVVISDWDGYFEINIKIPENTPTGEHTIFAETVLPENFDPDHYFSAEANFTGESYLRHFDTTVYKRKIERIEETVYIKKETETIEPVAQSFILDDDQFLSGLDLYFSHKLSDIGSMIWVNIREMINGYPVGKILYYKEIDGTDVDLADDPLGDMASIATHIDFDYPVYVEANKEYAFTVGSNRDGFHIYYAKMGNRDLTTNEQIVYQPHLAGVMFVSSNNNTWSAVQDSDIKYTLYRAEFSTTPKEYFIKNANTHSTIGNFSILNLAMAVNVLEDTSISSIYGINLIDTYSSDKWSLFNIEEYYKLIYSSEYDLGMDLDFKFTLKTDNSKVTPMINSNTLELFLGKYETDGAYVMIPFNLD